MTVPKKIALVMVWVGERYSAEYPAILVNMVMRHLSESDHDFAWFCITDRPDELPEGVNAIPADPELPGWWQKLRLFSPDMPFEAGQRVVYFDLDVAITGRLEDLVETKGIIKDWIWPGFNSSVMVWDHGDYPMIWERFSPARMTAPGMIVPRQLLPAGQPNAGDQEHIAEVSDWPTFPPQWFASYRTAAAWPPDGCKAVIFHGEPKPADITEGWVPNVWKPGGFTAIPALTGVNTSEDDRLANVRLSVQRDLEWFTGFGNEGRAVAIICGAPSMKDSLPDIRAQQRRGARIVSVNNVWRYLMANGVTPDVNVMLDARPENVEFTQGAPKSMRWLLASQCHPSVFDALAEHEVVLWHNGYGSNSDAVREVLAPWWDEGPNQKPCLLVPGGSTVGLRSLWLATFSGFRTIHLYGIDSSYAQTGEHHAYPQALNDGETKLEVARGEKRYWCAPWMVRQSAELVETWNDLRAFADPVTGKPDPVTIHVHGVGLIPDIARDLKAEARAA